MTTKDENKTEGQQQDQNQQQTQDQQQQEDQKPKFDPAQMPTYGGRSVRAVKITGIFERDGKTDIMHEHQFPSIPIGGDYMNQQQPKVGGYYVLLDDTTAVYVPADVFEKLYSKS